MNTTMSDLSVARDEEPLDLSDVRLIRRTSWYELIHKVTLQCLGQSYHRRRNNVLGRIQ